jgi:hypothetical protein
VELLQIGAAPYLSGLSHSARITECQQNCQQTALKKFARVVEEFA